MANETLFTDILTRLRPGFKIGGEVKEVHTQLKNKLKRNPTLQELREAEQKNWTEVTARIKANEFNSIISKRLASKDELKNIHKI